MTILHDVRSQRSLVSISVLLTQAFYTIPACAGNFLLTITRDIIVSEIIVPIGTTVSID